MSSMPVELLRIELGCSEIMLKKLFGSNLISFKKRKINIIVNKFVNKDENKKNNGKHEIINIEKKWFRLPFFNSFNSSNISIKIFF